MTLRSPARAALDQPLLAGMILLLGLFAVLRLSLVFQHNINWDEFYFLALIHEHQRGSLSTVLQTFHVHLFFWLTSLGSTEVDQVIAARGVFYLLHLGSCALLYRIGCSFLSRKAALFSVICYLTFSYVQVHGTSFRADGLAVFLCLLTTYLVLRQEGSILRLLLAALSFALAGLVTIKSIFYAPIVGALLLERWLCAEDKKAEAKVALGTVAATLLIFLALLALHQLSLSAAGPDDPLAYSRKAAEKVFFFGEISPGLKWILISAPRNFLTWLFLLSGVCALVPLLAVRRDWSKGLRLAAFLFPLATLLFYRNAYPYYYVFILPLPLVVAGFAFQRLTEYLAQKRPEASGRAQGTILAVLALNASVAFGERAGDSVAVQRQLLAAVHQIFPEPQPYIDRNSMVASFPKAGFFMSSWGLETYRAAGRPVFSEVLGTQQPTFLIANTPVLNLSAPTADMASYLSLSLLQEDFTLLRENFVPHWGPLFVAGKSFTDLGSEPQRFEIRIQGTYTVESSGTVLLNGSIYTPGATLRLERGTHLIAVPDGPAEVTLRWGDHLLRPGAPPPSGLLYSRL